MPSFGECLTTSECSADSFLLLYQNLSLALESSEATWKVVVGHHPIRSLGRHGDTTELVKSVLPILEVSLSTLFLSVAILAFRISILSRRTIINVQKNA